MRVNIKEVARKANVSISTISRVVNNSGPVKEDTRQKVIRVIDELEYVPNPLAQGLVKQTSRSIGLIIPKIALYFVHIIRGVEQVAKEHGYTLYICATDYSPEVEEDYIKQLILHSAAGVIIVSGQTNAATKKRLLADKMVSVYINREWNNPGVDSFYSDDLKATELIVNYLVDLGHRKLGVLAGDYETDENNNKLEGIFAIAKRKGLSVLPELIVKCPNTMAGGYEGAKKLLKAGRPTAVISFSDAQTVGAVHAAKKYGLKVPEEISFVGFNNTELAEFFDPPLTTVDMYPMKLGELACRRLFTQLLSKRKLPVLKKNLAVKLINRNSCHKLD
ncbi:MAG: LacI family DNA-binding transcriptional regulator [Clostridia bacterium]|nr:LacI family DNA-binding transcriptional regulator [Clostridia bacterium]